MKLFKNIINLFFPDLCIECGSNLNSSEKILCLHCKSALSLINISDLYNNKISNIFYGKTNINKSLAFLNYQKKGISKNLIQHLKYKNRQDIGVFLGNWFGNVLLDMNAFYDVDYIVPVPLHPKKQKQRGYNQLTTFGETLSKILSINYLPEILIREEYTETQTKKSKTDRFKNTKAKFALNDTTFLENKHILLLDDVITTGATIEACCSELQKTKNINISIVAIAFTEMN